MTFKYQVKGVGLDQIFDPYISGTKAVITNYTVAGVDLKDIFAPLYLGSSAAATNYLVKGADLNTIFAAKGTAVYALPINGNSYNRDVGRATARLTLNIKSDGTYSVVNEISTVLDSGTWLPSGDSVSSYTCTITQSGMTDGTDPGGGVNGWNTTAATQQACTTSQSLFCSSSATTVSTSASNSGTVTLKLYKSGVLRSTTSITFECSAVG